MELERPRLLPWYLNTNRLTALTGYRIPPVAQSSLLSNSNERVEAMRDAADLASAALTSGRIPTLTEALLAGSVKGGSIIASLWTTWTLTGVSRAFDRERRGLSPQPARLRATLTWKETSFAIEGALFNEHFYSDSSTFHLSRARRMLVAGQFTFEGTDVEVQPYIIGDLATHIAALPMPWRSQVRVYPATIDAFSRMDKVRSPSPDQVAVLQSLPEEAIKNAIADIVGEPFISKDWGGEKSDLTTNQVTIDQRPLSAAFIFKGPGLRGELHPANMGKRGDQLTRAFEEPVDLVVIQHWHKIAGAVVTIAEALASNPARPRRYCIMDGADTWRLLKAYGKLPA